MWVERRRIPIDATIAHVSGTQLGDDVLGDVQKSSSPGPDEPLVTSRSDVLYLPLSHVDRCLANRLDGVDENLRSCIVGDPGDFADRESCPVVSRDRTHTDQSCVRDSVLQVVQIDVAVCCLNDTRVHSVRSPRNDARGMFEVGSDNRVTGVPRDSVRDSTHAVTRTLREGNFPGPGVQELGHVLPRLVESVVDWRIHPRLSGGRFVAVTLEELLHRLDDVDATRTTRSGVQRNARWSLRPQGATEA